MDSKIIQLKKLSFMWSNLAAISHGLEDMNYFREILYFDRPTSSEKRSEPIEIKNFTEIIYSISAKLWEITAKFDHPVDNFLAE